MAGSKGEGRGQVARKKRMSGSVMERRDRVPGNFPVSHGTARIKVDWAGSTLKLHASRLIMR